VEGGHDFRQMVLVEVAHQDREVRDDFSNCSKFFN
jgi:hypothetical protein